MSLPGRQQVVLDQIERILAAADPQLKSMFAAFTRFTSHEAVPGTEAISRRTPQGWMMVISVMVVGVLSLAMLFVVANADLELEFDQQAVKGPVPFDRVDQFRRSR